MAKCEFEKGRLMVHQIVKRENNERDNTINNRKYDRLMEFLKTSKANRFTGYIKINFSQGNIGRIEKFEEILKY